MSERMYSRGRTTANACALMTQTINKKDTRQSEPKREENEKLSAEGKKRESCGCVEIKQRRKKKKARKRRNKKQENKEEEEVEKEGGRLMSTLSVYTHTHLRASHRNQKKKKKEERKKGVPYPCHSVCCFANHGSFVVRQSSEKPA